MQIANHIPLFLSEAYLYDIVSCHYQILKKYNLSIDNIEIKDKLKRNTQIGKKMMLNPKLTSFLRSITSDIIDNFITVNQISSDNIVIRQYDGIITNKFYKCNSSHDKILPELQYRLTPMIISSDRKSYIAMADDKVIIKGLAGKYDYLKKIYQKILHINYLNLDSIFRNLQKIKDDLYNENDILYFCIPEKNNKYSIYLKYYGKTEISKGTINLLDKQDIDIDKYFDFYLRPFTESIVSVFV